MTGVAQWLADPAHWTGPSGVPARSWEHLWLTAVSLLLAAAVALPLGLWLGHLGRFGPLAVNVSNAGRAIPTFAVLVLLVIGPLGLGDAATITALVLFAIPPMLTNAYVGVRGVDRDVVEAARGMGMSGLGVLRRVELPLSMPLLMAGVRLAAVQVVATATLAAIVGGGGLGRIITRGFAVRDQDAVLAGAVLVAALALLVEGGLVLAQRRVDAAVRGSVTA